MLTIHIRLLYLCKAVYLCVRITSKQQFIKQANMNKKFLQFLFIAVTAGFIFSSCSKDEELTGSGSNDKTQIKLTSSINQVTTRSTAQNTQIEADQQVGLMVTNSTSDYLYNNVQLIADGNGYFNSETPMYYPADGDNVNLIAYHPYSPTVNSVETTHTFYVEPLQFQKASYLNSDVLYGSVESVSRTAAAVPIQFNHAFSKLTFTVKKGNGATLEGLYAIEVAGLQMGAEVNLISGVVQPVGVIGTVRAYNVPTPLATDTEVSGAAAIVVPQTTNIGTPLLRILIGQISYLYQPAAPLVFKPGTAYNFNITVNMGGITVTSNIVDWTNGGSIDGDGEMD